MKLFRIFLVVLIFYFAARETAQLYAERQFAISPHPKKQLWSIGIYSGWSPVDLKPAADNPVLTAKDITDINAKYVADPFMITLKDKWYMFFEVINTKTNQGDIAYAVSKDGLNWHYQKVVLDEPFHLSYPYVFKYRGEFYMLPECHNIYEVRLYKAVEFPQKWKLVSTLLKGNYVDPSIIRHNGRWWLFTGGKMSPKGQKIKVRCLQIFYAKRLTGPWKEHPESPVNVGNEHISRPGGRVIKWNNRIIRYAQDDKTLYGLDVRAIEVLKLTTRHYKEKELAVSPILKGSGKGWNSARMHTCDPHQIADGKWLACVDGRD